MSYSKCSNWLQISKLSLSFGCLITFYYFETDLHICKVNSVQEACAKCFAVHLSKFEIVQTTWKKNKKHQSAKSIGEKLKTKCLMFIVSFSVICKISNSNMWTAKHLAQASCTELTLMQACFNVPISIFNFQPNEKVENNKYPINWPENSNSTLEIFWHQFQFIAHSINKSIQLKKISKICSYN